MQTPDVSKRADVNAVALLFHRIRGDPFAASPSMLPCPFLFRRKVPHSISACVGVVHPLHTTFFAGFIALMLHEINYK